jgi:hypothetical protein
MQQLIGCVVVGQMAAETKSDAVAVSNNSKPSKATERSAVFDQPRCMLPLPVVRFGEPVGRD